MSTFNEAALSEIEALFGNVKQGRFVTTQQAVTPYESPVGPGQINPVGFIADGAISDLTLFADTIRPVAIVAVLPVLPDTDYPIGSTVVLTTDGKLYRNIGNVWSANISTGGIAVAAAAPALPSSTYPAGSYYWNSVSLALFKTVNGTTWIKAIEAVDIVANTITAGQIAAGTITATEIAALTITAAQIAADTITAGQIAAGAIGASEIAANAVTAGKIAAGAVSIGNMASPADQSVTNGSFEIDAAGTVDPSITGWLKNAGTSANFVTSATSPKYGDRCLLITADSGTAQTLDQDKFIPVEGGRPYKLAGFLRGKATNSGTANGRLGVSWYDSAQALIGSVVQNAIITVAASTSYTESNEVQTAPSNAVYAKVRCNAPTANNTTGDVIGFDAINLYRADEDLYHGSGNVSITAAGVTITNGKLTLSDQFGNNVITGAGFGASWLDFIASGFYNGAFAVGTTASITAATETGGADTDAEYLASLSTDIPYWIVQAESGAGTLKRVADSTAVGGFALQWDGTEDATIYQDIPVLPGRRYAISMLWRYTNSTSEFQREIGYQFRKSDHSAIGGEIDFGLAFTTSLAAYAEEYIDQTDAAPADARYLRFIIHISRTSGSPTVWLNGLRAAASVKGILDVEGDLIVTGISEMTGQVLFEDGIKLDDGLHDPTRLRGSGNAFPSSPVIYDQWFRTDYGMWFFYDGTRWLSNAEYCVPIDVSAADISADPTYLRGVPAAPIAAGTFRYTRLAISLVVRTTHTSTKFWKIDLYDEGIGVIYTGDTSWAIKPAADAFGHSLQTLAVNDSGVGAVAIRLTKTSTPGNLFIRIGLYGRLIAT